MGWANVQARLKRNFIIVLVGLFALGLFLMPLHGKQISASGSSDGEKLFQANCLACHSIGGGDGVGPDLSGVTSERDREWLIKIITDPQALVDSGDQTVNQLVEQYGMVMPTLQLSDTEVESIISYLESVFVQGDGATQGQAASGVSQDGPKLLTLPMFALYGFLGSLLLYALIAVIWHRRLKGVRKSLQ